MRIFLSIIALIPLVVVFSGCSADLNIKEKVINKTEFESDTTQKICEEDDENWTGVAKIFPYIEAKNEKLRLRHHSTSPFCQPSERTELAYVVDDKKLLVTCISQTHQNLASHNTSVSFNRSGISGYAHGSTSLLAPVLSGAGQLAASISGLDRTGGGNISPTPTPVNPTPTSTNPTPTQEQIDRPEKIKIPLVKRQGLVAGRRVDTADLLKKLWRKVGVKSGYGYKEFKHTIESLSTSSPLDAFDVRAAYQKLPYCDKP